LIRYISYHLKFKKQCEKLKKSGSQATRAVENAEAIITHLKNHRSCFETAGTLTGKGELRLKNCLKYRLGNGYRLILLRLNVTLIILYIGSHNQSHKWLEKNKGLSNFEFGEREEVSPCTCSRQAKEAIALDPDEPGIINNVDEKYLRVIFRGICSGRTRFKTRRKVSLSDLYFLSCNPEKI